MTARPIRRNAQTPDRNGKIFYTSTTSLSHISKKLGHVTAEMTMHYVHVSEPQMQAYLEPYLGVKEVVR